MTIDLNVGTMASTLLVMCVAALGGLIFKGNRKLDQLIHLIESEADPPRGLLGRTAKLEAELQEMREWALKQGYDRRKPDA